MLPSNFFMAKRCFQASSQITGHNQNRIQRVCAPRLLHDDVLSPLLSICRQVYIICPWKHGSLQTSIVFADCYLRASHFLSLKSYFLMSQIKILSSLIRISFPSSHSRLTSVLLSQCVSAWNRSQCSHLHSLPPFLVFQIYLAYVFCFDMISFVGLDIHLSFLLSYLINFPLWSCHWNDILSLYSLTFFSSRNILLSLGSI